ncbi:hypothetical protein EXN66_Car021975 [Channa argus]|uniref:Uncharacterized protein n=1 Tax=Channa argus TaxID=215402 RepID=A0A6G1QVF7_CHAAH|nr:hypothetical protein EXN66_Car021975 [Channa argus]
MSIEGEAEALSAPAVALASICIKQWTSEPAPVAPAVQTISLLALSIYIVIPMCINICSQATSVPNGGQSARGVILYQTMPASSVGKCLFVISVCYLQINPDVQSNLPLSRNGVARSESLQNVQYDKRSSSISSNPENSFFECEGTVVLHRWQCNCNGHPLTALPPKKLDNPLTKRQWLSFSTERQGPKTDMNKNTFSDLKSFFHEFIWAQAYKIHLESSFFAGELSNGLTWRVVGYIEIEGSLYTASKPNQILMEASVSQPDLTGIRSCKESQSERQTELMPPFCSMHTALDKEYFNGNTKENDSKACDKNLIGTRGSYCSFCISTRSE